MGADENSGGRGLPVGQSGALRAEVRRMDAEADLIRACGYEPIDSDARVAPQPPESYAPAEVFEKVCTPDELGQLRSLLDRVRGEHDHFVGEKVQEVLAYYACTGEGDELEELLRSWLARYLAPRIDRGRLSGRNGHSPLALGDSVRHEYLPFLDALTDLPGCLNSRFLSLARDYCESEVERRLFRAEIREHPGGEGFLFKPRGEDEAVLQRCAALYRQSRQFGETFSGGLALMRIVPAAGGGPVASGDGPTEEWAGLASDIQYVRPFLVRSERARTHCVEVREGLWAVWDYACRPGGVTLGVKLAESEDEATRAYGHGGNGESRRFFGIDRFGVACDYYRPWDKVTSRPAGQRDQLLAGNLEILRAVHARVLECYARVRSEHGSDGSGSRECSESELDAAIAHSVADLAGGPPEGDEGGETEPAPGASRLPRLRLSRLLRVLQRDYACEVRSGEGSEITVYRDGERHYTFGRHKRDREVHPVQVRTALRRLGIPARDWASGIPRR